MPRAQRRVSACDRPRGVATRISRRALLGGAGLTGVAGCRPRPAMNPGGRRLTVWHSWGGVMAPRFARVLAAFERAHPAIRIRPVYVQNNLSANQKFFTAVAARQPPDVAFVDGPQVASWAEWGALEPLTPRVRAAGIRPEEYFTPTWRQTVYRDEVWALTYCADPNFGFAWNKAAFRRAGLDPERPPATIAELTDLAARLTVTEGGIIRQIGMIPWAQYGPANSMFTWGWVFGGEFYDPASGKITADHPRVVAALEWMVTFARRFDPARIASLQQGFGTAEQNPFYSGKLAMTSLHIGGIGDIERYAPDLDYGVAPIPHPPGGEARCAWVGGWCMSIPRGAANPDDAWEFIHWLCRSPEGTAVMGRETGLFPGHRASPYFAEVRGRRYYGDYVRILEESRHQRPVMPVQAFYMREMQRAVDAAVYGRKTPARALADARRNTQAELDLVLTG
jgi:multiple sugar transport system substrate-binding protein